MELIVASLFLCVVGYAIKCYGDGKKHIGALVYFFFVSHGFYIIPDDVIAGLPINKLTDFGNIYLLYILYRKLTGRSRIGIYLHDNKIPRLFMLLFVYVSINFVWTVVTGREQFMLSLAMYRNMFRFLSFVVFVDLDYKQLMWVFRKVWGITTIACVLYVMQRVVGIETLTGGAVGEASGGGVARYRNIPYLAYFFLVYATVRLDFSKFRSVLLLLLFAVSLVLTQHRGIMIAYGASIVFYLLLERKVGKMVQYTIIGAFLFFTVGNIAVERFERDDTGSDFEALMNLDYKKVSFEDDNDGGTLTFRFMHLLERADYLIRNPQYALLGVGLRHEDSPKTQRDFNFYICSRKVDGAGWYYQQLDTGDLFWSTPLIKTGFIGFGLYVAITICIFLFFLRNRHVSKLVGIALYYYVLLIVSSFKNDQLFDVIHLFMIFLIFHIVLKQKQQLKYQHT